MKDRERLEELINRKPSRWGNLTIKEFERDIKILQKQAEEKQELEEELEEIKGMYVNTRKLWLEEKQQNKRYETAFRRIKRDYAVQNVDYIPVTALYEIQLIIDQALQNNREG